MQAFESVDAVLDFAIKREEEAFDFYTDLAGRVERAHMRELFEQFAREVIEVTGSRSRIVHRELRPDDPKVRCPDIHRAQELLGWEPVISRREGLKLAEPWFRQELARQALVR